MSVSRLTADLGGTVIKTALWQGAQLVDEVHSAPNNNQPTDLIQALEPYHGQADELVIAVPGVVDREGIGLQLAYEKYDYLRTTALGDLTSVAVGLRPLRVLHDGRAALLGELADSKVPRIRNAVLMMLGTGIGTAVLIDGRMFEGNSGHGGILGGHLTTTGTATRCNCGNVGCAEATGGGWAVERQLHELMGPQTTDGRLGLKELFSPAMGSDEGVLLLRSAVLDAWCCCALNLVQAYDPQVLLLSGGGSQLPGLERAIRNWLDQHLWGSLPRPEIIVSAHPDMSVLRGLAVWQSSE